MSSQDQSVPAIASPSSPLQAMEILITAVRTLASGDSYREIASIFDEAPLLRQQIASKEAEITKLRARYEDTFQTNLEFYRTTYNKLEEEKIALSRNISMLGATVQEKEASMAAVMGTQEALEAQLRQITESFESEKENITSANSTITKLQEDLKAKDTEIKELRETLNNDKSQISNIETKLEGVQKDNAVLKQKLRTNMTRLTEIEDLGTELNDDVEDTLAKRLDELWASAFKLMDSHFQKDLPEKSLENLSAWKRLREAPKLGKIPLPQSNSLAAKQMRIAAMLGILARSIDEHIFQPTYILSENSGIRGVLLREAITNSQRESFCRALLLSIDPEEQKETAAERVDEVIIEVARYVQDLFPTAEIESFREGLKEVVQNACDFWQDIQRATDRFEPSFDLAHFEDLEWKTLSFDEQNPTDGTGSTSDDGLVMIFPRIYVVADAEPEPITPGVVLRKSQSLAAAQELDRKKHSSPISGRAPVSRTRSQRVRKMSTSLITGSPLLSQETPPATNGGGS